MKVFAPAVVRAPVVHDPPVEPEKLVHVPLVGEKVPLAGPFVIVQVNCVVSPYLIMPGLAKSVHVGETAPLIFTVYVPLIVWGPGFVQLSFHATLKVHVPDTVGVPDIVAPELEQLMLTPLQLEGVHCVLVYGV